MNGVLAEHELRLTWHHCGRRAYERDVTSRFKVLHDVAEWKMWLDDESTVLRIHFVRPVRQYIATNGRLCSEKTGVASFPINDPNVDVALSIYNFIKQNAPVEEEKPIKKVKK